MFNFFFLTWFYVWFSQLLFEIFGGYLELVDYFIFINWLFTIGWFISYLFTCFVFLIYMSFILLLSSVDFLLFCMLDMCLVFYFLFYLHVLSYSLYIWFEGNCSKIKAEICKDFHCLSPKIAISKYLVHRKVGN